jgi:hypothetical protein
MASQKNQDRIIVGILGLVSSGSATLLQPALLPFTLSFLVLVLLLAKFSNEQILRVIKYVLFAVTSIIVFLWLVTLVGLYALWRLLS